MTPAGLGTSLAHSAGTASMIASGDGGDDESELPRILRKDCPLVAIPPLKEGFLVSDFFSANAAHGLFAEVCLDFLEIFGRYAVGPSRVRRVARHALLRSSQTVAIERLFPSPPDIGLHALSELILHSTLPTSSFRGLDDTPLADEEAGPRQNLVQVDGWWISLFRVDKKKWHLQMPDPGDFFAKYTKVFVPE